VIVSLSMLLSLGNLSSSVVLHLFTRVLYSPSLYILQWYSNGSYFKSSNFCLLIAKLASTWSQWGKIYSNLFSYSLFGSSAIGLSGSCKRLNFNPPSVFFLLKGELISGWISLYIDLIPTGALGFWISTWSGLIWTSSVFDV